jgi:hypothetical protein
LKLAQVQPVLELELPVLPLQRALPLEQVLLDQQLAPLHREDCRFPKQIFQPGLTSLHQPQRR